MANNLKEFELIKAKLIEDVKKADENLVGLLHERLQEIYSYVNALVGLLNKVSIKISISIKKETEAHMKFIRDYRIGLEEFTKDIEALAGGRPAKLITKSVVKILRDLEGLSTSNFKRVLKRDEKREIFVLTRFGSYLESDKEKFKKISKMLVEFLRAIPDKDKGKVEDFNAEIGAIETDYSKVIGLIDQCSVIVAGTRKLVFDRFARDEKKIEALGFA